jgi:hypothetical protein
LFKAAQSDLHRFLDDKTAPPEEIDEACHEYLHMASRLTGDLDFVFGKTEPLLFANWSKYGFPYLLKGEVYILYGWAARGRGTADKIKPEGWQEFAERLAVAQTALEEAWKLDPKDGRIARSMMDLELGQGKGRDRLELWFNRAMELAPNDYDACKAKLYYLEPKWYGSAEEMLSFGRECAASEKWNGFVPLVLAEAHDSLSRYAQKADDTNYWQRAEVWPDVKASFERFFTLHPEAFSWRHNYARYAYLCEQWDSLNEQLKLLGEVNYDYFGGKAEFEKMASLAAEHTRKPAPRKRLDTQ